MIDLMTGDVTIEDVNPPEAVYTADAVSLPIANNWQEPYTDTWTATDIASDGTAIPVRNTSGDLSQAITSSLYSSGAATPGAQSGFLDSLDKAWNDAYKQISSGAISAGTAAAKSAIGTAIGGSNPQPTNSNTNLANKSLLSKAVSMQQSMLGGIMSDGKGGTNYWAVGGIVVLLIVIMGRLLA
jgi:hypothetical protein